MRAAFAGSRRRLTSFLAATLAAGSVSPLCGQAQTPPLDEARVLVRVNGEPLYAEDLESVLGAIHRAQQVEQRSDFDVERLVFRVVNDTLLAQEARALGMHELPEVQRRIRARREAKARGRIYREEVVDKVDQSDESAREVYEDVFRVAHLRVVTRRDLAEAEALRPRALEARDDESFKALAREVSKDPYAGRGGVIDTPLTNLFPSLYEFASSATAGELSQPLATQWGWTLARLVGIEPADPAQFEARRERALGELRRRQEGPLRAALVELWQPKLGLEIDRAVYESVDARRMHDGRLLPQFEGPERVVARVAGRPITLEAFAGKLASAWSALGNPAVARDWKRIVLDELIFEELMVAEGLRRGYGDAPEVRRELHALELSLIASHYLKEVVATRIDVTPQEAREYFDRHRDEFRRPPRVHQLQLTVATREEADRLMALARAGADFGWLARQYSTDPFREGGGEVGWALATEGVALFSREVANAVAGQVYGPREGPEGWVVLKVDLVEGQGHFEFETVSGNVEARIQGGKIAERIDQVIRRLREGAEIWTDAEAIAALSIAPTVPAEGSAMPGHDGG